MIIFFIGYFSLSSLLPLDPWPLFDMYLGLPTRNRKAEPLSTLEEVIFLYSCSVQQRILYTIVKYSPHLQLTGKRAILHGANPSFFFVM